MNDIVDALTTALQELPAAVKDDPALWGATPEKLTIREIQSTLSELVSESARYVIRRRVAGNLDAITAGLDYGDDVAEFLSGLEVDFGTVEDGAAFEIRQDQVRDAIGKAIAAQVRVKLTDPEWMPVARGDARLAHMHDFIDKSLVSIARRAEAVPAKGKLVGQEEFNRRMNILDELNPEPKRRLLADEPTKEQVDEWGEPINVTPTLERTFELAQVLAAMKPKDVLSLLATGKPPAPEPTIFELMTQTGLSDGECGELLGMSRSSYNNHKRGQQRNWPGLTPEVARPAAEAMRARIALHEAILEKITAFVPDTYDQE